MRTMMNDRAKTTAIVGMFAIVLALFWAPYAFDLAYRDTIAAVVENAVMMKAFIDVIVFVYTLEISEEV